MRGVNKAMDCLGIWIALLAQHRGGFAGIRCGSDMAYTTARPKLVNGDTGYGAFSRAGISGDIELLRPGLAPIPFDNALYRRRLLGTGYNLGQN